MYILDSENNKLVQATVSTFKALGLEERKHLQEWIAATPSSLGEDLLIIQKEFDGFAETKERLDLLALDKQGQLVIIENKLDDSGKDVTWQAIKYASYCSSLSKSGIVEIFEKFLGNTGKAKEIIVDFLGASEFDEVKLNPDNSQRIFFVAANFRKEVTSSVLWLSNFGLNIKCFKVTPFQYNGKVLIDFDQIIPIKDAEEYTIKMAAKIQEAAQDADTKTARQLKRQAFWQGFINYCKSHNGSFASSAGTPDSWLGKSVGVSGISVVVGVNNNDVRTELYINIGNKEENKQAFDFFHAHKDKIEQALSDYQINWARMDDRVTCRIFTDRKDLGLLYEDKYEEIYKFFNDSSNLFLKVLSPYAKNYQKHHNANNKDA